jgi:hypothetical protein
MAEMQASVSNTRAKVDPLVTNTATKHSITLSASQQPSSELIHQHV